MLLAMGVLCGPQRIARGEDQPPLVGRVFVAFETFKLVDRKTGKPLPPKRQLSECVVFRRPPDMEVAKKVGFVPVRASCPGREVLAACRYPPDFQAEITLYYATSFERPLDELMEQCLKQGGDWDAVGPF